MTIANTPLSAPEAVVPGGTRTRSSADELSAMLKTLKLNLQETRQKLMLVDPDRLADDEHARWSEEVTKVSLAITKVRNVRLESISSAFAAALPDIEGAAAALTEDLAKLRRSTDVINAVGSVLGIVEKIVTLLA